MRALECWCSALSLCPLRQLGHLSRGSSCNLHWASSPSSHLGFWPWVDMSPAWASFPQEQATFLPDSLSSHAWVNSPSCWAGTGSPSFPPGLNHGLMGSGPHGGRCQVAPGGDARCFNQELGTILDIGLSLLLSGGPTQVLPILFPNFSPSTSLPLYCPCLIWTLLTATWATVMVPAPISLLPPGLPICLGPSI